MKTRLLALAGLFALMGCNTQSNPPKSGGDVTVTAPGVNVNVDKDKDGVKVEAPGVKVNVNK